MHRRALFRSTSALIGLTVLSGCNLITTTTTNGVTTVTVAVAQIVSYAQAAINFTQLILGVVGVVVDPTIASLLRITSTTLAADLQTFVTENSGKVTLSFDSTSVPSSISSLLTDCQKVLTLAKTALGDTVNAAASEYIQAFSTVVSVFQGILGFFSATKAPTATAPQLTETAALAKLGVVR